MTRSPFQWPTDGSGAILQQHSVAKLEVLREYLIAYFKTLAANPRRDRISLTLVDGFAGGGVYRHVDTDERILGSPLVLLQATEQAKAIINAERRKPLLFSIGYIFVEKDASAIASLRATLKMEGYAERLGSDIHVVRDTFEAQSERIIQAIKERCPNTGRALILLDQYGYKDVPTSQIRTLFARLPKAEIVLTFAVDAFINFASDNKLTKDTLKHLGVPDILKGRSFAEIKENESHYRLFIQSALYKDLVVACGAGYYTPFFIRTSGHGDYWLIHLSQHPRARDVMTQVHWDKNNHFIHYGGAGLDMFRVLGYDAKQDETFTRQGSLDFKFDDEANQQSINLLTRQLVRLIYQHDTISFERLYESTCNLTPTASRHYREALEKLVEYKEVEVGSPQGARRLKASTIKDNDLVRRARQSLFPTLKSE